MEEKIEEAFQKWSDINRKRIYVYKGEQTNIDLALSNIEHKIYPIKKEDINKINFDIDFIKFIEAPVLKNTQVGQIEVYVNATKIETINICVSKEIKRKSVKTYMMENLKLLIYG